MDTLEIRRKLHDFIAEADDNKVKGMYLLLEDDINLLQDFQLSRQQLQILEEEREKHLSDESKLYTWEEVKQFVRRNKTA